MAKATKRKEGSLGRFLYSLRIQRGSTQVSEYLRAYNLPISDVYYRDIESGAKLISLDKASEFCDAIQADRKAFFFHLLRDLLPEDVVSSLLRPVADDTFSSLEERQAILERDKDIYREALAKAKLEESHVLSSDAVQMLVQDPQLMPILHFLYALESASAADLSKVVGRNGIGYPVETVARKFVDTGLAIVDGIVGKGRWRIRRRSVVSRTPLTPEGKELKDAFAIREVGKCLDQGQMDLAWSNAGSFVDTSIVELSPKGVAALRARIFDVLAEAYSSEESVSKGSALPYFLGIFVGSRVEYTALEQRRVADKASGNAS